MKILAVLGIVGCADSQTRPDELVGHADFNEGSLAHVNRGALWYRVVMDGDLNVRVRLLNPPHSTRFFLPGRWGGRDDFGGRITIQGAFGPSGARFMTIDRSEGEVEIDSNDIPWVELAYRVTLDDPTSPLQASMDDGVVYAYGPAFLVVPAQQVLDHSRDIHLELLTPSEWHVASTWQQTAEKASEIDPRQTVRAFTIADGHALRDAFVAAGRRLSIDRPSNSLKVAYGPDFRGDRTHVTGLVNQAVNTYRATYGDLGDVTVLVRTNDDADKGNLGGLGRRGGFVVELPRHAQADSATALLVWHEALHLWNGHFLMPAPAHEEATRWFKEGVTHYLAIVASCHAGAIKRDDLYDELARIIDAFERNPVRRNEAADDLERARFPYDFGALIALEFDAAYGDQTVSRWLQTLMVTVADKSYSPQLLRMGLAQISGDASSRLVQVLSRQEPLRPRDAMESIGLHFIRGSDAIPRIVELDSNPASRGVFGACSEQP